MNTCQEKLDEKPLIMGILNATPDSFSDGGLFDTVEQAVNHGLDMEEQGADIIDVGGESTRPGSNSVAESDQISRVLPVITALRKCLEPRTLISIDTTRASVAEASIACGASIINDVSAGRDDPRMFELAAETNSGIILMHMQGQPKNMQCAPLYEDVVGEILNFLLDRADTAMKSGIERSRIFFDPGIGFGKRRDHNLQILMGLDRICAAGYPVVLGASRKQFMGSICGVTNPNQLLGATVATTAWGVAKGVKIFRVHNVRENRQAADVVATIACSRT